MNGTQNHGKSILFTKYTIFFTFQAKPLGSHTKIIVGCGCDNKVNVGCGCDNKVNDDTSGKLQPQNAR